MKKLIIYAFKTWFFSVLFGSILCAVACAVWSGDVGLLLACIYLTVITLIVSIPVFPAMVAMAYFAKNSNTGEVEHWDFFIFTPIPTVVAFCIGFVMSGADEGLAILAPYQLATWGILAFRIYKGKKMASRYV